MQRRPQLLRPRGVLGIGALSGDSMPMHRGTRDAKLLQHPRIREASQRIGERLGPPMSTDARHNLFRILK